MEKKQPNLPESIANEVLMKIPCAAMVTEESGRVVWCNERLMQLVKANAADIIGQPQDEVEKHCLKTLPDRPGMFFIMQSGANEPEFWLKKQQIPLNNASLIMYNDVTETTVVNARAVELQNRLNELSTVDPVSGLLNRRAMLQNLEPLVSRSRRYNNPLSVIAMDLADLEVIKQRHGEPAVHHVIKQVSFLLKDTLRWADLVSRIEDSRFVFVLPETNKDAAVHLARKINANVTELNIAFEGASLSVSACFGVAAWEKGNDSVLLLRHATQSLELANQQGPGSIQDC